MGRAGSWGGVAKENRPFLKAVFGIWRSGAPWRDWPPEYGGGKPVQRQCCRWRDQDIRGSWLELLAADLDDEGRMMDATHSKVPP